MNKYIWILTVLFDPETSRDFPAKGANIYIGIILYKHLGGTTILKQKVEENGFVKK